MNDSNIHLATSSCSYQEWEGAFYQKGEKPSFKLTHMSSKSSKLIQPSIAIHLKGIYRLAQSFFHFQSGVS